MIVISTVTGTKRDCQCHIYYSDEVIFSSFSLRCANLISVKRLKARFQDSESEVILELS